MLVFLIGDEDAFSLELIQYLAHRGARKFILVTKNRQPSGYKTLVLKRLNNKNVTVVVSLADLSTVKGAEDVLNEAANLGPVSGIYHISTVSTFNVYFTLPIILNIYYL